jgi:hypothetical protein
VTKTLSEENAKHVAALTAGNAQHAADLQDSNQKALASVQDLMHRMAESMESVKLAAEASLAESVEAVRLATRNGPAASAIDGPHRTTTPAQAPNRRTSIVPRHPPTAGEIMELSTGRRPNGGELSLLQPSEGSGIAVVILYTQLHSISPADVRVYGDQACTFAGNGRRVSLERLLGQQYHVGTVESYAEALQLIRHTAGNLFHITEEKFVVTNAPPIPFPQHWAALGHTARTYTWTAT